MFFVTGTGEPWLASGTSGTRISNDDRRRARWSGCSARASRRSSRRPRQAVFTPVDTSEPQSLSRAAAPGAALVLVGLLGLLVVRGVSRRSR